MKGALAIGRERGRDNERREVFEVARVELGQDGVIVDHSAAAARSLGFDCDALCGEHVSRIFPQLAAGGLLFEGRVSPRLAFLCRCGFPLEGVRADGGRMAVEVSTYVLRNGGPARVMLAWPSSPVGADPRARNVVVDSAAHVGRPIERGKEGARLRGRTEKRVL